ncbi:hypothetical protein OIU78_017678 [Salix suchowensis]|nr:hypothetical protein OIU78_017678 [Salix suchowensis]
MSIASQSDYNQVRINLMLAILKARQDSDLPALITLPGSSVRKWKSRNEERQAWLADNDNNEELFNLLSIKIQSVRNLFTLVFLSCDSSFHLENGFAFCFEL